MIRTFALAACAALPVAAHDLRCGPREPVAQTMAGESLAVTWMGHVPGEEVVELWTRADGRWIVTATNTQGMTCIVGAGYGFEVLPAPVAGVPG